MNVTAIHLFRVILIGIWALCLGSIIASPHLFGLTDRGELLIRNTIRLALLYWAIAVTLMLRPRLTSALVSRLAWTLGCIAYLVHVAFAFHYAHHWSHDEAFDHVKQAGGIGEGIFVSYFFTLLWTVDVIWWWFNRCSYEDRPHWLGWTIHGFMVFMIVNGAIVFESGAIRWAAVAGLIGIGGLLLHTMKRSV